MIVYQTEGIQQEAAEESKFFLELIYNEMRKMNIQLANMTDNFIEDKDLAE